MIKKCFPICHFIKKIPYRYELYNYFYSLEKIRDTGNFFYNAIGKYSLRNNSSVY